MTSCTPPAIYAGSDQTICLNRTVILGSDSPDSDLNYSWTPTDGLSSSSDSMPTFTPPSAGTYIFTLVATRSDNSDCFASDSVTITVDTTVSDLQITASPSDVVCAGNVVTLTASGADHYSWSTGATTSDILVSDAGTYTVTGYSQNNACSSDASITITVDTPVSNLQIAVSPSDVICVGQIVTLTASGADHYTWSTGATTSDIQVSDAGTYTVTGHSQNNACADTTSISITVRSPIAVDGGSDQTIFVGSDVIIGVGPALSDVTYTWSPADGVSDIHAFPTSVSPFSTTTYTVFAQRTDAYDCISSDQVTVNVSCYMRLSDVQIINSDLKGNLIANTSGTKIVTATYGSSDHVITVAGGGTFSISDFNWGNGGALTLTAYQSDNPSCSDTKQYGIGTPTISGLVQLILQGSLFGFELDIANFTAQTSDVTILFSDFCAFAQAQSDGQAAAILTIINQSDMFASDAVILNSPQNVFVNCSGQCLNIRGQSDAFTFQICSFTSDSPAIQYSDNNPANTISDHSVTIVSAMYQSQLTFSVNEVSGSNLPVIFPSTISSVEGFFMSMLILVVFVGFGILFSFMLI